ncbi:Major facilitator superfamily domain general substrate transporter [Pyrenophora tritici-repentis]|nr:general substrate transporter [Pyrenophora tritici-repentis]KAI2476001.1 Major facilitator superfamily domain general substrate transporter [Pyrenophora tritici-repentis]
MAPQQKKAASASAENNSTQTTLDVEQAPQTVSLKASPQAHQNDDSLTEKRHAEPIPRSFRRGLLGRLTIIPEVSNPYAYGNGTKWLMTVIVSMAACTSSFGSSVFYPALGEVSRALHTSPTVTNLSLAFYMLAMAVSPLWWSAFSESLGRRNTYFLSFSLFVVFSVISAVSVNIAMLIVMRILSGAAAASVHAVGAGTVADIWEPKERGRAMGVFYLGPLCGPGLAPIIGGLLSQHLGWRSTLWFLAIFGGGLLLLIILCLPETLAAKRENPNASENNNNGRPKKRTTIIRGIFNPPKVLALLRHPPVLVAVYSGSMAFGSLFIINIAIQSNFSKPPHSFNDTEVGLLYLAPTLGYAVASLLGGPWIDYIMAREARKANRYDADGKLVYLPEDRFKENIWLAATLYPAGLIWYGWAVDKDLHWMVSCVASFFFGIGSMLVFGAVTTVLTEFTPKRSSSGVAVNNLTRNILSCTCAVVTQPLIDTIRTGWTCTMIGLFTWVTGNAALWAIKTRGPQWRVAMDKKLNHPEK